MKIIIEVDGNSKEDMADYISAIKIDNDLITSIKFEKHIGEIK